jgi:RNA polymerase sigma factor (sigma-70 family)
MWITRRIMNEKHVPARPAQLDHSVSQFIDGLREGDEHAAQVVWERFVFRLVELASRKLKAARRAEDEEDIVQRAFADFFRQVQRGRFPQLHDRHDLWQVLCMLVDRRAIDAVRRQNSRKQGQGRVQGESFFCSKNASGEHVSGLAGSPDLLMPTPELAMEMSEVLRQRLDQFESDEHRQVALLKLRGFTNREIAGQLGSSVRTVERWLDKMRQCWLESTDDGTPSVA